MKRKTKPKLSFEAWLEGNKQVMISTAFLKNYCNKLKSIEKKGIEEKSKLIENVLRKESLHENFFDLFYRVTSVHYLERKTSCVEGKVMV